ncbi:MAG: C39 family peptidase [Acutalibacteraceae bacterium]
MRKQKRRKSKFLYSFFIVMLAVLTAFCMRGITGRISRNSSAVSSSDGISSFSDDFGCDSSDAGYKIAEFAREHNLRTDEWPDELAELLDKNPDTESFVLNYPLKKDKNPEISIDEYKNSGCVPLLFQWDERWGYSEYAGEMMGISGCGPTCLSMVCVYLLNDTEYNPRYIADFSESHGYSVPGNGSSWTLISEGGKKAWTGYNRDTA